MAITGLEVNNACREMFRAKIDRIVDRIGGQLFKSEAQLGDLIYQLFDDQQSNKPENPPISGGWLPSLFGRLEQLEYTSDAILAQVKRLQGDLAIVETPTCEPPKRIRLAMPDVEAQP